MTMSVLETHIGGIERFSTGKVRDVYDLGDSLLLVASDRISAFDVVMPNGIPDKGRVLTQMSRHWFRTLRPFVATHYITTDIDFIEQALVAAGGTINSETRAMLTGRTMLGVKAAPFPIECVVRGYLAGSLWKEYCEAGGPGAAVEIHGVALPAGLQESAKLPTTIFTPATKAASGHDENISVAEAAAIVGEEPIQRLQQISIELYERAENYARRKGIMIADTKFEFGLHQGEIVLIDEALTPDSSRFWEVGEYEVGKSQNSFDKQFVRDWLIASGWSKNPPAPHLPDEIVEKTADKYREAYRRIVGREVER